MNITVQGLYGMGDNIYQRPFIRALLEKHGRLWLQTSWPELYEDMPHQLFFLEPQTNLRTQAKNIQRNARKWVEPPKPVDRSARIRYGGDLCRSNIPRIMAKSLGMGDTGSLRFDLPDFREHVLVKYPQPFAVVRPVTIRREWSNPARNPDPRYVQEAVWMLKAAGYYVISVADIEPGKEDYVDGPLEGCDQYYDDGQLTIRPLLALIQSADLVVGGVGWIVPACIAAHTPLFVVGGGQGGHNAPERITDPRMDLSRVGFALPDNYCRCTNMRHNCPKTITGFGDTFKRFLENGCRI